jgi:hypothetical protein
MRWAIATAGTLLLAFGLMVWLEAVEITRERTVLDVGPLEAEVEEKRPLPRGLGIAAAVGGVLLIATGLAGRRT